MKKIKLLFMLVIALFGLSFSIIKVHAASLSLTANASTSSTVVGNTFTITFKYSSKTPLGAVYYSMTYDSDLLTLTSGTQSNALSYTGSATNDTIKFTFKAKKSGNATVKFKINEALDFDENVLSADSISKTITIKTQKEIEESYSKNNNLTKITLSNGTLSPEFDKNKTSYSATVENDVTSITVSGTKEDSKSSVSGFKEYELEEGVNKIDIRVTAQNGSSKTYTINVTRKELSPILVKIDNEEFSIVRKKESLPMANNSFEETTITINEEEVPAYHNEATNTYLVGLKNNDGEIKLYEYKDGNYLEYKEVSFSSIIITTTKLNEIPEGFVEETITINDEQVTAYKNNENEILVSGINIKTGKENIYKYDKEENTLQIYNNSLLTKISELNNDKNNYLYVIIGLGSLLIITYIVLLLSTLKKDKNKKPKQKKKKASFFFEEVDDEKENQNEESNIEEIQEEKKENEVKEIIQDEFEELDKTLQLKEEKKKKVTKEVEIKPKKDDKIKEDVSKEIKRKKK